MQVIKGFDTAVTGLAVGESRKSRIPPVDAYGETDPAMVMSFPREGTGADGLQEGVKVKDCSWTGIDDGSHSIFCSTFPVPISPRSSCPTA